MHASLGLTGDHMRIWGAVLREQVEPGGQPWEGNGLHWLVELLDPAKLVAKGPAYKSDRHMPSQYSLLLLPICDTIPVLGG